MYFAAGRHSITSNTIVPPPRLLLLPPPPQLPRLASSLGGDWWWRSVPTISPPTAVTTITVAAADYGSTRCQGQRLTSRHNVVLTRVRLRERTYVRACACCTLTTVALSPEENAAASPPLNKLLSVRNHLPTRSDRFLATTTTARTKLHCEFVVRPFLFIFPICCYFLRNYPVFFLCLSLFVDGASSCFCRQAPWPT